MPCTGCGQFFADGKGNILEGSRSLSEGGEFEDEVFTGTYTVNPNGTGNIKLDVSYKLPDGSIIPACIEDVDFVITQHGEEFYAMLRGKTGPNGEVISYEIVSLITGKRQ